MSPVTSKPGEGPGRRTGYPVVRGGGGRRTVTTQHIILTKHATSLSLYQNICSPGQYVVHIIQCKHRGPVWIFGGINTLGLENTAAISHCLIKDHSPLKWLDTYSPPTPLTQIRCVLDGGGWASWAERYSAKRSAALGTAARLGVEARLGKGPCPSIPNVRPPCSLTPLPSDLPSLYLTYLL